MSKGNEKQVLSMFLPYSVNNICTLIYFTPIIAVILDLLFTPIIAVILDLPMFYQQTAMDSLCLKT